MKGSGVDACPVISLSLSVVQASPVFSMRIADDRSTVATVTEEGDRGPAGQEALDNIVAHVHISMEERRKISSDGDERSIRWVPGGEGIQQTGFR